MFNNYHTHVYISWSHFLNQSLKHEHDEKGKVGGVARFLRKTPSQDAYSAADTLYINVHIFTGNNKQHARNVFLPFA